MLASAAHILKISMAPAQGSLANLIPKSEEKKNMEKEKKMMKEGEAEH